MDKFGEFILALTAAVVVVGWFIIDVVITVLCVACAIILWWIGMIIAIADGVCEFYAWSRSKIFS